MQPSRLLALQWPAERQHWETETHWLFGAVPFAGKWKKLAGIAWVQFGWLTRKFLANLISWIILIGFLRRFVLGAVVWRHLAETPCDGWRNRRNVCAHRIASNKTQNNNKWKEYETISLSAENQIKLNADKRMSAWMHGMANRESRRAHSAHRHMVQFCRLQCTHWNRCFQLINSHFYCYFLSPCRR